MKQKQTYRIAILALSASIVLPIAPVFGQDTAAPPPVVVTPPSPVTTAPPPPRIVVTPPAARQPAPAPAPRVTLPPVPEVQAPPPSEARTATRAIRAAPRARAAAPRATPAPAPAAGTAAPAPAAEAPLPAAEPVAPVAAPPAALSPATGATGEAAGQPATGAPLLWLLAALAVIAAFAFFALRRRRRTEEDVQYEEPALVAEPTTVPAAPATYQEPLIAPAPTFAREPEPAAVEQRVTDEATVAEPDETDVAALAASSEPVAGRPWLEFLLRPLRAGTSRDETIVHYELTVANTGGRGASNVRLSTWLFPAGTSEMERSLIEAPAEARTTELDIAAGEGARIEGEIGLAKAGSAEETILPVLVAEARYRLPDGSEGRTRASFEIGMQANGELAPFPLDRATGLVEFVEARLHGEPERV